MEDHEIPHPEVVVSQFTEEEMQELFSEIGYSVGLDEMSELKKAVAVKKSVEEAFRDFLATKQSAAKE